MKLFQTIMGKRFYEGHVPKIVKALESIAIELKRFNDSRDKKTYTPQELEKLGIKETYPFTVKEVLDGMREKSYSDDCDVP